MTQEDRSRIAVEADFEKLQAAADGLCQELDRVRAQRQNLIDALQEVRELISGYVDIKDGVDGPLPNDAMRAERVIIDAIAKTRRKPCKS